MNCSCVRTYMDPTVDWFYQIRLIRPKSLHFEKKEQDCFKNFSWNENIEERVVCSLCLQSVADVSFPVGGNPKFWPTFRKTSSDENDKYSFHRQRASTLNRSMPMLVLHECYLPSIWADIYRSLVEVFHEALYTRLISTLTYKLQTCGN